MQTYLRESCSAYVTFVRLFTGVYSHMTFELKGVRTCVCAVAALVRALSSMASVVAEEDKRKYFSTLLKEFHCRIITNEDGIKIT